MARWKQQSGTGPGRATIRLMASATPLLEVEGLRTVLTAEAGTGCPVDGISFSLEPGGSLALVGESGCGKTLTALSLLGLLPPNASVVAGTARFDGADLLRLSAAELRAYRGNRIGMVFQNPASALNPVITVGSQLTEVVRLHRPLNRREGAAAARELLGRVRLPDPERVFRSYPHELSGGMQQRAGIAMALAGEPELLIADEPTTALDVTVQHGILELLKDLREELGTALLLISHDLGVVQTLCVETAVLYAGKVVERGPTGSVLATPLHPYTRALLACLPRIGGSTRAPAVPGRVPSPFSPLLGCPFRPRCPEEIADCSEPVPLDEVAPGRWCACLPAAGAIRS